MQPFRAPLRVYDGGSDELLGVRDVARRLGVSTASVYRWAGRDTAARAAVVQHHPVRPADVAAFVAQRLQKPSPG